MYLLRHGGLSRDLHGYTNKDMPGMFSFENITRLSLLLSVLRFPQSGRRRSTGVIMFCCCSKFLGMTSFLCASRFWSQLAYLLCQDYQLGSHQKSIPLFWLRPNYCTYYGTIQLLFPRNTAKTLLPSHYSKDLD